MKNTGIATVAQSLHPQRWPLMSFMENNSPYGSLSSLLWQKFPSSAHATPNPWHLEISSNSSEEKRID